MKRLVTHLVLSLGLAASASAATQLISNGDFEGASLAGWTVNIVGGGFGNGFYLTPNGAPAPVSGHPTLPNPSGGLFAAVSDQFGPGGEEMRQAFVVAPGTTSLMLTFDWFNATYSPYAGTAIDGSAQAGRADILFAGAAPLDTGGGVAMPLLLNAGVFDAPMPWVSASFDLSALPPGAYELRFGNGQCCFYQQFGVDNVSLLALAVPEPAGYLLFGPGLIALAVYRHRRGRLAPAS